VIILRSTCRRQRLANRAAILRSGNFKETGRLGVSCPSSSAQPAGICSRRCRSCELVGLEEATRATVQPMMSVFNNLVLYDQHIAQSSLETVVPDLATSWPWSEDGKELSFPLRQGVKWHDGKSFTAAEVKCTWDLLMGTGSDKLRINPR